MTIGEMFEWRREQRYRLRTGRRAYTGPAYRDHEAFPSTSRRAHLAGGFVVSVAPDEKA